MYYHDLHYNTPTDPRSRFFKRYAYGRGLYLELAPDGCAYRVFSTLRRRMRARGISESYIEQYYQEIYPRHLKLPEGI